MAQHYRRTQTKHRKAKKEQGWPKLERIEMDCIWVNLTNVGPPFFKFISFSLYQIVIYTAVKIILSCYRCVALILLMRLLLCQFEV